MKHASPSVSATPRNAEPPEPPLEEVAKKSLVTPREYHRLGGPAESTQAKQRMQGTFGPYLKIGNRIYIDLVERGRYLETLRRLSTSDNGSFK